MKINWKLRLKNKTTLTAIVLTVLSFTHQLLELCGITTSINESEITALVELAVKVLVMLGIIIDPTTSGICDSAPVLDYQTPKIKEITENKEL
jgi:phi LC3 family holin